MTVSATEPRSPGPGRLLSIGRLAAATGIAPDTLRAWERRYGRPQARRLPSGHRRYSPAQARWLRRVAEALALGGRPAEVLLLDDAALGRWLAARAECPREPAEIRDLLVRAVAPGPALAARLEEDTRRLGAERFLLERAAPLAEATGRAWADGRLCVRHEHLITELLQDRLRELRRRHAPAGSAGSFLFATLPGETHGLGVQMAALACALQGTRPAVLGTGVPLEEIAAAASEGDVAAVGISVSLATGGVATDRRLAELGRRLPAGVRLVAGGKGARRPRRGIRGVEYFESLDAFGAWVGEMRAA